MAATSVDPVVVAKALDLIRQGYLPEEASQRLKMGGLRISARTIRRRSEEARLAAKAPKAPKGKPGPKPGRSSAPKAEATLTAACHPWRDEAGDPLEGSEEAAVLAVLRERYIADAPLDIGSTPNRERELMAIAVGLEKVADADLWILVDVVASLAAPTATNNPPGAGT